MTAVREDAKRRHDDMKMNHQLAEYASWKNIVYNRRKFSRNFPRKPDDLYREGKTVPISRAEAKAMLEERRKKRGE
jgi:hypothetical protein